MKKPYLSSSGVFMVVVTTLMVMPNARQLGSAHAPNDAPTPRVQTVLY